jgi:hypothetical protein
VIGALTSGYDADVQETVLPQGLNVMFRAVAGGPAKGFRPGAGHWATIEDVTTPVDALIIEK